MLPDRFLHWCTNYRDLDVSLNPLKLTFSGDNISAIRGSCVLKFLHAIEIDQSLLAHTRTELAWESPPVGLFPALLVFVCGPKFITSPGKVW